MKLMRGEDIYYFAGCYGCRHVGIHSEKSL